MTIKDPFAAEAPDEPQTVEPATAVVQGPPARPAAASEGKVVVTLKGGRDFDAPWIVIHAADVADANAQLNSELAELMGRVQMASKTFRGGSEPQLTGGPRPAPQGATQPPAWFPAPPDPSWVYKTGFKNGKTWHAWAPAEKGGGEWQFHRQP